MYLPWNIIDREMAHVLRKNRFRVLPAHRLSKIVSGFQRYGSGFLCVNIDEIGLVTLGSLKDPEREQQM
jgi:hypothetical protein